jgi:para-aminobenzoate synthetase component 1
MPWTFSQPLDPGSFASLARVLASQHRADLFFSGRGFPGETRCLAGIEPCEEFLVTPLTTGCDIKAFALGPGGPALGFLGYPYGQILRGLPIGKQSRFPLGHFKKYAVMAAYDQQTGALEITSRDRVIGETISALCRRTLPAAPVFSRPENLGPCQASLDRQGYQKAVSRALERIRDGDIYQVSLSIMFSCQWPEFDGPGLFFDLLNRHPAPFFVWFASGRHRILSASPERFISVRRGRVLSQPIKGTARIGAEAAIAALRLRQNPKEDAELSMIVDLIRNDISRNCAYGSVAVSGHKSILAVDDLLQMYSNVSGILRPGRSCLDLFFDAFPGGSVTGCPKQSALGIIDALEPHSRDIYCGAFMVIGGDNDLDSSVAIRTAVYDTSSNELKFYAGSGIVIDSDPASEYEETRAKAENFLRLVGDAG